MQCSRRVAPCRQQASRVEHVEQKYHNQPHRQKHQDQRPSRHREPLLHAGTEAGIFLGQVQQQAQRQDAQSEQFEAGEPEVLKGKGGEERGSKYERGGKAVDV